MKRIVLIFSLIISLLSISSCGSAKWIDDGNNGDQPWLNYRTLDEYIEVICPHFFEGIAVRGANVVALVTTKASQNANKKYKDRY